MTIIGSKSYENLKAAPRFRLFYTGRWHVSTTCEDLERHLKDIGIEVKECEKNIMKHGKFVSFKFECEERFVDKVKNPDNWPIGVTLGRWVAPKSTLGEQSKTPSQKVTTNNQNSTALTQSSQDQDMTDNHD